MAVDNPQSRDPGDRDLKMALQIRAQSHRTLEPFLVQAKIRATTSGGIR